MVADADETNGTARKRPRTESMGGMGSDVPVGDLPPSLRAQLVDDWNYVSQERRLVPLPAKENRSVCDILKAFQAAAQKSSPADGGIAKDTAAGVESAFNAAIGSALLYPFERLQFAELCIGHPDVPFSQLFGVEHLTRLLVLLPSQLALEKAPPTGRMMRGVEMLAEFLSERSAVYFADDYEMAPPPYIRGNTQLGHGKAEA